MLKIQSVVVTLGLIAAMAGLAYAAPMVMTAWPQHGPQQHETPTTQGGGQGAPAPENDEGSSQPAPSRSDVPKAPAASDRNAQRGSLPARAHRRVAGSTPAPAASGTPSDRPGGASHPESPGNSGEPGNSGGNSGSAPGHDETDHGNSGSAPGHNKDESDPPGNSGSAPAHADGTEPPGKQKHQPSEEPSSAPTPDAPSPADDTGNGHSGDKGNPHGK